MRKLLCLFIICMVCFLFAGCEDKATKEEEKIIPSTDMADAAAYYGVANGEVLLITDGQIGAIDAIVENGDIYVPITEAMKWDSHIYWNEEEEQMIVSTASSLIYYWPDNQVHQENETMVNGEKKDLIMKEGSLYVSYDCLLLYCDVNSAFYEEPNRIVTWTNGAKAQRTTLKTAENGQLRTGMDVTTDILVNTKTGEVCYLVASTDGDWTQVMTENGMTGYVETEALGVFAETVVDSTFAKEEYTHLLMDEELHLVWHQVFAEQGGSDLTKALKGTVGVNVVCPTWFKVTATDGAISSFANQSYVEEAHEQGIKVWALVDDFTPGVPGLELLSNSESRKTLIANLISEVVRVKADGINVDFEYITAESAPHYIQFLRELYLACREQNLYLSTDNYVPTAGNSFYELAQQQEVVDYICIMAYDEHHSNSEETGSIASLPFAKNGMNSALSYVPAERLVMGVPFFTRKWMTSASGEISSEALGMDTAKEFMLDNGATWTWNEECKQYYAEFTADGVRYQIWLEDMDSMRDKLQVIDELGLAGYAAWKLGMESPDIWKLFQE